MAVLAFVAAEPREFQGLLPFIADLRDAGLQVRFGKTGQLRRKPVILLANGPGPKLAAEAVRAAGEAGFDAVVSTGFCGALDPGLDIGRVIVANAISNDGSTWAAVKVPECPAAYAEGPLLSVDRVAASVEEKADLRKTAALAVEMEAWGVRTAAEETGAHFYCVRVVSDTAREGFSIDFNKMRDEQGRFSTSRIIWSACRKPVSGFSDLVRLWRNSRVASAALGEFLADCTF